MRKKILIVDDDESIVAIFKYILEDKGYSVLCADSVEIAQEQLRDAQDIGLIFMDLRMPDGSGADLISRIKLSATQIPVVLITGYAQDEMIRSVLGAGAAKVMLKPFDQNEILDTVKSLYRG